MLSELLSRGFEFRFESHAAAILEKDFPDALAEISQALSSVEVPITEIVGSGGGKTKGTQRMRKSFAQMGWKKRPQQVFILSLRKLHVWRIEHNRGLLRPVAAAVFSRRHVGCWGRLLQGHF